MLSLTKITEKKVKGEMHHKKRNGTDKMPRITELKNKPSMQLARLNIVSLKTKENGQNLSAL